MVKTVNLIKEVLQPFITNKALLVGLAISEIPDFRMENLTWTIKYNSTELLINLKQDEDYSDIPSVGIPGGYLGIQAFYLIFENFWRNLVKHTSTDINKHLEGGSTINIFIELRDKKDTPFWKLELWSSTITNSGVAEDINKLLEHGIINEKDGTLHSEGWGTKEMLVGAAHLCGASIHELQKKSLEILRCHMREEKFLTYSFHVLKPMRVTIVTDKTGAADEGILNSKGVYIYDKLKKNFVVPTEYLVGTEDQLQQTPDGCRPLKQTPELSVDYGNFQDNDTLLDYLIKLESEFAKKLLREENKTKILFGIWGGQGEKELSLLKKKKFDIISFSHTRGDKALDESKSFPVIFDRHGRGMNESLPQGSFYEPYGGGTHTEFMLRHTPKGEKEKDHLLWSIVSAALLKVMILDERIQQIMGKSAKWAFRTKPFFRNEFDDDAILIDSFACLNKMRIFIPSGNDGISPNLSLPVTEQLFDFIEQNKPQLISVHAGILDKLSLDTKEKVAEWIKVVRSKMSNTVNRVVIHSGRGIPNNVPDYDVPFIGYGSVEHWIVSRELKSKYGLVNELLAARGVKR